MNIDETEVAQDTDAFTRAAEPYSAKWWAARTTIELRDIIKRGFGLGQAYDGAIAETERRAREALRRVREEQSAAARKKAKMRLAVLGAILAVTVAILLLDWFAR